MSDSREAATTSTAAYLVRLPYRCVLPSFGDQRLPCNWRIERMGDVVWCHTHGGTNAIDQPATGESDQ